MPRLIKRFSALCVALVWLAAPVAAGDAVLTLTGDVRDGRVVFDDDALSSLPQVEFASKTLWTDGTRRFSGPSLAALLDSAGAGDGDLRLVALNNYSVDMPRDAVEQEAPIVAHRIDGNAFGIRRNGPFWVLFPYDQEPRFQSDVYYAYSVWQLNRIEVLPK